MKERADREAESYAIRGSHKALFPNTMSAQCHRENTLTVVCTTSVLFTCSSVIKKWKFADIQRGQHDSLTVSGLKQNQTPNAKHPRQLSGSNISKSDKMAMNTQLSVTTDISVQPEEAWDKLAAMGMECSIRLSASKFDRKHRLSDT